MPGKSTTSQGRSAPAARASSARTETSAERLDDPGAAGVDGGLAALILAEAGGGPAADRNDRAAGAARASQPRKPSDERARDEDAETEDEREHREEAVRLKAEETSREDETDEEREDREEAERLKAEETSHEDETDEEREARETEEEAERQRAERDETPAWAKKRFSELSDKIRDLRKENAELRHSPETAETRAARPLETQILLADTPEAIDELRDTQQRLQDWALDHREGIEADPEKPEQRGFTREEVGKVLANSRNALRQIERREKELGKVREFDSAAFSAYPALEDADTAEARAMENILRTVPELRRLPNYRLIIGDAIAGGLDRVKQAKAAAGGGRQLPGRRVETERRPPAPGVREAPRRQAEPTGKEARRKVAREKAFKNGSEADVAGLVEAALG